MRVGVHGLRYGGVTEHLLDDLRIDVLREKQGSAGVAQAVEGEALTPVLRQSPARFSKVLKSRWLEIVVIHGLAHAVRENKVVVFPLGSL